MDTLIRRAEARRTTTPNATMTTFASPTQGASRQALWRVEMAPGAAGPDHVMAGEQIWAVVAGAARVEVAGEVADLGPGDTLVLPAGVLRRIHADADRGLEAVVTGPGDDTASGPGREPVVPPWIA
ncbi:quercetin dioxygenase-like cupin family protein [Actinomycetospora succinea]|uniref:Quercetin dioxygenase-like cupin family protein n=1 Tax=Actinomycetospora succinea TaxID=663603 RepID=A0A4R6VHU7_9PSEU|nr:cupin domain-containing protein [Actinomycetospora succinea]TDQ60914.1 quercetin dioxygenase-like cupin family protein [Actinomycetospora succinea]